MKKNIISNMEYRNYIIDKDYKYVYFFLKEKGFSENYITNLRKRSGYIKINNVNSNTKSKLKIGDILSINSNPNTKTGIMQCIIPLDIVYEDEYYLLVNKPSNLSTMPTQSHYNNNLAGAICYYMENKIKNFTLRIINRLDKETAGLILIAKDTISQKDLKNFQKSYHAICQGKIKDDVEINKPIKTLIENGKNVNKRIISDEGKSAKTCVHPLKIGNSMTLVEINLIHGRTHQIRVHLSSINHPLVGDKLYGNESKLINHTALLCKKISFYHPYLNKEMNFEVDYPEDFQKLSKKIL